MAESYLKAILGLDEKSIASICDALNLQGTDRDVISLKMTAGDWENNKNIRDAVAFIGFDARKIVAQFFKKAKEGAIEEDDQPVEVAGFKLYSKNDAQTDLLFFLNVFLERGNNLQKALLRCDDEVAPVLRRKANAYGIVLEKTQNKTILGTKHLTLARIAQAFSFMTAALILKDKIPSKLTSRLFLAPPLLMTHTVFPSLIPIDVAGVSDPLRDMATFINIEMSHMLSDAKEKRRNAVRTLEDLMEQSKMYVDAAMIGSVMTNAQKCMILTKASIVTIDADRHITLTEAMKVHVDRLAKIKELQAHTLSSALANIPN